MRNDDPQTSRKLSQLLRAMKAVERLKECGWLDDVSTETMESLIRLPETIVMMTKILQERGNSWVSTLGIGAELIAVELIIRRAVEERVKSVIDDPEIFVNVGLTFLSPEEMNEGSGTDAQ